MLENVPILSLLILIPLIGAIIAFMLEKHPKASKIVALVFTAVPMALSVLLLADFSLTVGTFQYVESFNWISSLGISYKVGVDGISIAMVFLTTLLSFLAVLFSWDVEERTHQYMGLMLVLEVGVMGVFTSMDYFLFYVFWEVVLIPMYFLIAIWGGPRRSYASIKFFIYTHIASLVMLLGILALYFQAAPALGHATFDMQAIASVSGSFGQLFQIVVFGALFFGFIVKMPMVPFHTWLPDAHVEAPTAGSVLLAGLLLKMGSYGIIRICLPTLPYGANQYQIVMVIIAIVSILYGAVMCLAQKDLKKMIAYSSISHMGIVMLGIATLGQLGIAAAIFQMFAHGLITAVLFMMAGIVGHHVGTRNMPRLGGLAAKMPYAAVFMMIGFMASLGLPGMVGFLAEFSVFTATFDSFGWLLLLPIISVALTAAYYIWAMQKTLFGPLTKEVDLDHIHDISWFEAAPLVVLTGLIVLFGMLPALIFDYITPSVKILTAIVVGGAKMIDIQAIRPDMILALFAIAVPAVGLLSAWLFKGVSVSKVCAAFSLVGVGLAFADAFLFIYNNNIGIYFAGNLLKLDQFSALFMLIFLAVAFYVILASARFIQEDKHQPEFYSLIMVATVGMMIVASSQDLITLFVGIELTSISSYALVAFRKKDPKGAEAAVKIFIIGGLSSGLTLFGISLFYGIAHTTTFAGIGQAVTMNSPMQSVIFLALVMVVAGLGFKVAIAPFHMWAPDVYEGAPTTVTAMLAAGSKKMGFVALFKVFLIALFAIKSNWDVLIGILAIVTMTVGNLAAINQTNIKRMLAYSSIAQAGYILIALPVAAVSDHTIGQYALSAGIMQIMTHAFMKGGAFLIVATLATVAVGESITNYKGLAKRAPFMAFGMTVLLFSLAGIPPLAGFFSKFVLFSSPINASSIPGDGWMIWLAVAAIINSAISLYYYVRVVKYMYVDEPEEGTPTDRLKLPTSMVAAVAICVFMVILIGIWPDPFFEAAKHAASAFF